MIKHTFKLDRYNWTIIAFYDVSELDEDYILDTIKLIGCRNSLLNKAKLNMEDGMLDNGFAFSNFDKHISVIVIGYGSNDNEAMNTLAHEARHVEQHISKVFKLEELDEERYYLIGKLIQTMYSVFRLTLVD